MREVRLGQSIKDWPAAPMWGLSIEGDWLAASLSSAAFWDFVSVRLDKSEAQSSQITLHFRPNRR